MCFVVFNILTKCFCANIKCYKPLPPRAAFACVCVCVKGIVADKDKFECLFVFHDDSFFYIIIIIIIIMIESLFRILTNFLHHFRKKNYLNDSYFFMF